MKTMGFQAMQQNIHVTSEVCVDALKSTAWIILQPSYFWRTKQDEQSERTRRQAPRVGDGMMPYKFFLLSCVDAIVRLTYEELLEDKVSTLERREKS